MKNEPILRFKRIIVFACLIIAGIHITACLYLNVFPSGPLSDSRLGSFYKTKVLIGPFFIADRLKVSPHLMISYKEEGEVWSAFTDNAIESVKTFQRNPWRYAVRSEGIFLRGAAKKFNNQRKKDSVNVWTSNEFITLNSYLAHEVFPAGTDSVKLIYILNTYDVTSATVKSDTAWTLSYTLHDQVIR